MSHWRSSTHGKSPGYAREMAGRHRAYKEAARAAKAALTKPTPATIAAPATVAVAAAASASWPVIAGAVVLVVGVGAIVGWSLLSDSDRS